MLACDRRRDRSAAEELPSSRNLLPARCRCGASRPSTSAKRQSLRDLGSGRRFRPPRGFRPRGGEEEALSVWGARAKAPRARRLAGASTRTLLPYSPPPHDSLWAPLPPSLFLAPGRPEQLQGNVRALLGPPAALQSHCVGDFPELRKAAKELIAATEAPALLSLHLFLRRAVV